MTDRLSKIDVDSVNEAKRLVITLLAATKEPDRIEYLENLMLRLTTTWVKCKHINEQGLLVY